MGVFDKMFAATQGLLWLALVAATSATPAAPPSTPPTKTAAPPCPSTSSPGPIKAPPTAGLIEQVEGDYVQSSLPATNNWHYVSISKKKENLYNWKNKAGIEWDLILIGEESGGVVTFKVGDNCGYKKGGYTEARLFAKGDTIEIEGPYGTTFTKEKK